MEYLKTLSRPPILRPRKNNLKNVRRSDDNLSGKEDEFVKELHKKIFGDNKKEIARTEIKNL